MGKESLRVETIGGLMHQLMSRYRIAQQRPETVERAVEMYSEKARECRRLQQKVRKLQEQNSLLLGGNNVETDGNSRQVEVLLEKVGVYQATFRKEEEFVGQLKLMLAQKQERIRDLVEEYECQLQQIKNSSFGDSREELRSQIQQLNQLVRQQETLIIELAGSNTKSTEENRLLKRKLSDTTTKSLFG